MPTSNEDTIEYLDPTDIDQYGTPDVHLEFGYAYREVVIESDRNEQIRTTSAGARELAVKLNAIADLLEKVVEIAEAGR